MSRRIAAATLGARGRATAQDILAAIAALWTLSWILTTSTSVLSGDLGALPAIEAAAPPAVALVVLLGSLAWALPGGALTLASDRRRWRAPLYLLGLAAAPMILALHFRRRVDRSPPDRWLDLPRWVALRVALASLAVIAGEVPILLAHWPRVRVVDHVILWLALSCTVVVAAGVVTRLLARRELLRSPAAARAGRGTAAVDVRPTRALAAAAFGLTVAPMIVGHLWHDAQGRERARAQAEALGLRLLASSAPGSEAALGALLGEHPGVGVRTVAGALYGGAQDPLEAVRAGLDPGRWVVVRDPHALITVPIPERSPASLIPFGLLGLLCAAAAIVGASSILRGVDDDARRLQARVDRIRGLAGAGGAELDPAPPRSRELDRLGDELGHLRRRLDDLEIARFLAVEAADARDRRQVDRLAALSAELRQALVGLAAASSRLPGARGGALSAPIRGLAERLEPVSELAALLRGEAPLRPQIVPLAAVLARAVARTRARRPDLRIELRSVAGPPPLHVDPARIEEALVALMLFAGRRLAGEALIIRVDHDPQASPAALRLEVLAGRRPVSAVEAAIARRPFRALPQQPERDLGLARADAILRLGGGDLTITALGEGMVLTATLPTLGGRRRLAVDERVRG